ncbi:MAG TPA: cytochrome P450 [Streptosporangiaceae bacterium]|nr:cytochrome P450 [Streptosporangiaceae bacterium]
MQQSTSAAEGPASACLAGAPAPGCPVSAAAQNLADPLLYTDVEFRLIWDQMRAADHLEWTQVNERDGFWSVVRYDDADRVLRDTQTFTSERGTLLNILGVEDPAGGRQIAATDPPRHTIMRARLQKALASKAAEQQQELITRLVREVIEPLADGGPFDFAAAMLALPVAVGGESMGLPRADWPRLAHLLNSSIAAEDPEYCTEGGARATLDQAHRELFAYFQDIYHQRRRNLGDDLVSVLITTEVDGRTMSPGEVMSNCYSVLLGAVVTTPHSPNYLMSEHIGDGLLDRWAANLALTPTAVEEALRLGSPVSHFMRYAVRDAEVRGTSIKAGQAVVVWLGAANRDCRAFPDAETFDLRRKPNKHLAFGIGPHYCVGHAVARVTLRSLFNELLSRFTSFAPAGEPARLHSNFISGYKHLPITAQPVSSAARRASRRLP